NLTTIGKLDTILNTVKQEVKECLRLLGIPFQTGDSLMSMLKKLVKACEEIEITGPVQRNLLRYLKMLDPKTQINNPKSFGTESSSMDALVKACFENSRDILNKEQFENRPEIIYFLSKSILKIEMSENIENVHPKVLQIPSSSGELDRIQEIINTLSADKKKLQDEIELLKLNNPLLEQENKDLKDANNNLKKENDNLKTSNDTLKKKMKN
ncbi:21755_t:CDS:2, partial [Racocetra persica]